MSSSRFKFVLDENVRVELYKFLQRKGIDVKFTPKGLTNGEIAELSLNEERVLVTNDEDFAKFLIGEVFGVVWLKIPQNDPQGLIKAFSLLLKPEFSEFKDRLVILWPNSFEVSRLWEERRTK